VAPDQAVSVLTNNLDLQHAQAEVLRVQSNVFTFPMLIIVLVYHLLLLHLFLSMDTIQLWKRHAQLDAKQIAQVLVIVQTIFSTLLEIVRWDIILARVPWKLSRVVLRANVCMEYNCSMPIA
jgi:hypothetical protein